MHIPERNLGKRGGDGALLYNSEKLASSLSAALYIFSEALRAEPSPPVRVTMFSYTVTVSTGSQWFAGTDDYIYITLVGTEQCSERTLLDKPLYNDFERGAVSGRRLQHNNSLSQL